MLTHTYEGMKVLLIGSGGREHAMAVALSKSIYKPTLYCLPGNAGVVDIAELVAGDYMDFDFVKSFCLDQAIDFAIVSPDDPLCAGLVDVLEEAGIASFGPSRAAARLEGSKAFAKAFMQKMQIPTASYEVFDDLSKAKAYVDAWPSDNMPIVLKADGLALGKGVLLAESKAEANLFLEEAMLGGKFGASGKQVLIEECLQGPECSYFVLSDGENYYPLMAAMDHKAVGEGNIGPNTGGMGVLAPNPHLNDALEEQILETIVKPTIQGMRSVGSPFKGCLFVGLMLTEDGPKVIEYNARFGDPETEAILPLLEDDFLDILINMRDGKILDESIKLKSMHSVTVILCSRGYPGHYEKGFEITFDADLGKLIHSGQVQIYHSGTKLEDGRLLTNGGRVLAVSAQAATREEARAKAYKAADLVHFEGVFYRRDIGQDLEEK